LQPTSFPFCPFLLPIPLEGKGKGERAAVGSSLLAAGLNHDSGGGGPSFPSSSSGTVHQGMNVHLVSTYTYSLAVLGEGWGFYLFILTCVAGLLGVQAACFSRLVKMNALLKGIHEEKDGGA